jgi:hypothetical protein
MDAWVVEMTLISIPYGEAAEVCKEFDTGVPPTLGA